MIVEDEYFLATDLEESLRLEGAEILGSIYELSKQSLWLTKMASTRRHG
ncbi:hypothetical protein Q2941_33180 [Bradyrhizobium sp. UFLA05-153]